jgi:putative oxidoreductase
MFRRIIATTDSAVPAIARLAMGFVMLPHGLQKTLGMFGGPGFNGTMQYMTTGSHIPYIFALLAVIAESLGALGLIVGLLGRVAAFGIACEMLVAVALVHSHVGFFMNWNGTQKGEGFEYHILMVALAIIVMIAGSGAVSIDRALTRSSSGPRA